MATIKDGSSGNVAKVNLKNQLYTFTVIETETQEAAALGNSYNINTGEINLTSSTESGILYIKNNEDSDLVIEAIAVGVGSAGTVTDVSTITIIRNPTAGTVISDASTVSMNQNRNFGSSKTLAVNAYKGDEGKTFTDGDDVAVLYQSAGGRLFAGLNFELPKGSAIGVKIDTQTSSGTTKVYAAAVCYLKDPNA